MKKLWILMMVWAVACGDDTSSTGSNTTNNAQANQDAGGDATFDVSAEDTSNQTNNTAVANNSGNTNNATNNVVNNTTNNATNNATNNTPSGATCMEILQCLLVCNTGDTVCQDGCKMTGTAEAQQEIDTYLTCVDTLCADATGVTELTECVLNNCGEQQDACLD